MQNHTRQHTSSTACVLHRTPHAVPMYTSVGFDVDIGSLKHDSSQGLALCRTLSVALQRGAELQGAMWATTCASCWASLCSTGMSAGHWDFLVVCFDHEDIWHGMAWQGIA